jgi:hypothetical protein
MENLVDLLKSRGYEVVLLSDQDLEQAYRPENNLDRKIFANLAEVKTLVLPNTRRMSQAEVENVRRYVSDGGTVLAIMQSSYRDASDRKAGKGDYRLGDLLGISYSGFSWAQGEHSYIKGTRNHRIWQGMDGTVENVRGWAMVNSPTEDGRVLGAWYDSGGEPSNPGNENAAIVEGNRSLYVGEQLLAPENFQKEETRQLLGNMVDYLYGLEPLAGERTPVEAEQGSEAGPGLGGAEGAGGGMDPRLLAGLGIAAAIAGYVFLF